MKLNVNLNKMYTLIITGFLLISITSLSANERQSDHNELRQIMNKVVSAVNNRDLKQLKPYLAKNFIITMVDQSVVTSFDDLVKLFHEMFEKDGSVLKDLKISPKASVLTIFPTDNIGYDYGTSTDTYTLAGGKQIVFHSKWTATVIKENKKWKLLNLHIGVSILDNPLLEIAEKMTYVWSIVTFFIAALLFFLVGKSRGKDKKKMNR